MTDINGWALLLDERDYHALRAKEIIHYDATDDRPAEYPCMARAFLNSCDESYLYYLYPSDVGKMATALSIAMSVRVKEQGK